MKLSEIFTLTEQQAKDAEFMPTGFKTVDDQLDGGFLKKELIVLGGHTGRGKSYVAGQIMSSVARKGFKCGYFSLEISNKMIVARLVGAISNLKPTRVIHGFLTIQELNSKKEAEAELLAYEDFLNFYDDTYLLDDILKIIKEETLDFAIVDFIQNVLVKNMSDEYARLSHVALQLQKAAKENNACILILSQLSNMVAREGSRGKTTEYKGSGNIATVADLGFILEREDYLPGTEYQDVTLTLKKNRRGISGLDFKLRFQHPGGRIYEA